MIACIPGFSSYDKVGTVRSGNCNSLVSSICLYTCNTLAILLSNSTSRRSRGLRHAVAELKDRLGVTGLDENNQQHDLYSNYSDFVKRVLEAVREDLCKKNDCWFEYSHSKNKEKWINVLRVDNNAMIAISHINLFVIHKPSF